MLRLDIAKIGPEVPKVHILDWRPKHPSGYDEQTYASPYWIVRYPHRKRLQFAINGINDAAPEAILDYGAGDGRMLLDAIDAGLRAQRIIAFEPVAEMRERLRANVADHGAGDRIEICSDRAEITGTVDFIVCLEVLEHMPLREREAFYSLCGRALRPDGTVLIDVPVEVGPTLIVKALGRRLLKGRLPEYRGVELLKHGLGWTVFDPVRFSASNTETWINDHKGFDYRLFAEELRSRFATVDEETSPFARLPAGCFNQVVFFRARGVRRPDSENQLR